VTDSLLRFPISCAETASTTIGGQCNVLTTADSIMPGLTREGKRSIWELSSLKIYDGGADGDADTVGDNTLFEVQGFFTP
jgi:hypothetical protein